MQMSVSDIIGIIGIVFSAVAFMKSIMIPEWNYVAGAIISFLLYGSIIYAQKKQNPALYLPFLILNGIGIVFIGVYLLVLIVIFAFAPNELDLINPQMKESEKGQFVVLNLPYRNWRDHRLVGNCGVSPCVVPERRVPRLQVHEDAAFQLQRANASLDP
ncbi:hypothetical protein DdX_14020 [Ditylenchus destructor]|uniref:Uncharacterized protein n=1 Tax=Ditylenchus destructor TaxID=166010 RepID=A0AAD4MV25_9BILA|nr:hypothetical protein DdX_14020 [Ditylenchus destructor]